VWLYVGELSPSMLTVFFHSKSNFWMTSDQRLIIKTLVNAWNVADLCVSLFDAQKEAHRHSAGRCCSIIALRTSST
jgi:hypothetical protein